MLNNCSFPCIACNDDDNGPGHVVTNSMNNCSFSMCGDDNDKTLNMFCTGCLQYSSILASKMMNNCSFQCLVCNKVNVLVHEFTPIAFSHIEDFAIVHVNHVPMIFLHMHHSYFDSFLDANGD